ncbi:hypothetical protein D9V37_10830 [Nocardioides mangrovicus]|uniref:SMP-30/Gluconolactonase/LRE-like region domain-containing protein n=1 Tax=Nocardioides mangrovicus TaxID=2478913 RepID=A0A3L8P2I8_9ACTN|nr:hypothetical protein [Nocardioides mangrovicus]RLV49063.1 hypothetical protein D9V37_10830 [Nocardioides mangrovicus]
MKTIVYRAGVASFGAALVLAAGSAIVPADAAAPYGDANLVLGSGNSLSTVSAADGTTTQVATGLSSSYGGVATDAAGNLYYAEPTDVLKFPVGGGAATTVASGFSGVNGIAVDTAGNLYVADYSASSLIKVPADGSAQTTLITGQSIAGVAVDSTAGVVYAATTSGASIISVPVAGGAASTVATNLGFTTGVALAPDGSLYASDYFNGPVYHVVNGVATTVGSFNDPHSVGVDAAGNLYVVEEQNSDVVEVPADGSANRIVATGTNGARGLAVSHSQAAATTPTTPVTQPTQLPAKVFGISAHHRAHHKLRVKAAGLAAGEQYRITLGKHLVATGTATSSGEVSVKVKIPACTYRGHRVLRITGRQTNRTATAKVRVSRHRSAACGSPRYGYGA